MGLVATPGSTSTWSVTRSAKLRTIVKPSSRGPGTTASATLDATGKPAARRVLMVDEEVEGGAAEADVEGDAAVTEAE